MRYVGIFLAAAALAFLATTVVRRVAARLNIIDRPGEPRKIHSKPIPLLGGAAIFASFWLVIGSIILFSDLLPARYVSEQFLLGLFIAGFALMVGGFLDDRYRLRARFQLVAPIIAILVVIGSGMGIAFVSNPLGPGLWHLDTLQWDLFEAGGRTIQFVLLADFFTVIWLLGMMFTTKLLDGLDGLVSGITAIGAFILFALSLSDKTFQPDVALLAVSLAGATLGFLFWNAHPAKIFLGEGGSVWLGFMLGVLAIISGGKVATALLVMGVPILDVGWVIVRRVFLEKKSPAIGDSKHLHFRLLTAGLSHRQSVLLLWGVAALFGVASLFVQTRGKVYLLTALVAVMILLGLWSRKRSHSLSSPLP
ncbi:MAG: undecaprenyl/decaprenyl-phosphate alpha-N-acetylglucosaminyl 1-phosphate transferase [Parcubacteria group bacterium]|nr:undecaprenyl/decaprenyl-phosphate alpha-N-acetylglucosaminyl 1-phosphate transferase [Parcubacteria group bacterium]